VTFAEMKDPARPRHDMTGQEEPELGMSTTANDDQELHGALLAGTPGARQQFYRRHVHTVVRWCARLGGRGVDPEDAAHEVFIVALEKVGRFKPGRFEPWLFAITRRVVANHRRRAAARTAWAKLTGAQLDPLRPPRHDPHEASVRSEAWAAVCACLERLSAKHREVLVLCELEDRTAVEVAAMLRIPQGTVYTRLHYAKASFRRAAEQTGLHELIETVDFAEGVGSSPRASSRREPS